MIRLSLCSAVVLASLLSPSAHAQVTGVPGVNDYTVAGMTSGSTSCPFVPLFGGGSTVFNVSTAPNVPVVILFNVNCPCTPCVLPMPASTCGLPPAGSCTFPTDQSFDLNSTFLSCVLLTATLTSDAAGNATLTLVLPPLIRVSTQAATLHPCNSGSSFPPLFTQAYQIST